MGILSNQKTQIVCIVCIVPSIIISSIVVAGIFYEMEILKQNLMVMSATMTSIDETMDGWLMHFYTVGFVEYVELLGMLIFYRISFKKKITAQVTSTLYAKTQYDLNKR
jgi:hypothetical protein